MIAVESVSFFDILSFAGISINYLFGVSEGIWLILKIICHPAEKDI